MSEYRIEKVRRHVTISLVGGTAVEGDIFLQPSARYRTGPQDPAELFNEAETFLPVSAGGDGLTLIAKEQVTRVQFSPDPADTETEGVGGGEASVDIVFADGSTVTGEMRLETRVDRSRLLDFLNADHQKFLTLRTPAGVCLVNRRQVAQVRQRR